MSEYYVGSAQMIEWRDKLLSTAEKIEREGDEESAQMFFFLAIVLEEKLTRLTEMDTGKKGFKNYVIRSSYALSLMFLQG